MIMLNTVTIGNQSSVLFTEDRDGQAPVRRSTRKHADTAFAREGFSETSDVSM